MWVFSVPVGARNARSTQQHSHSIFGAATAAVLLCLTGTAAAEDPEYATVVTAPRPQADRGRLDEAASSSVITADRTPRSAEDLPRLLGELPGVTVTRFGGLGTLATLSLRGSSANQVEVYFDGVPLSAASGEGVDISLFPAVDLGTVEVYRGMSPIAFGTSAMGGIVSLGTPADTDSGMRLYAGGGSFGTYSGGVQNRWAGQRVRALASVNVQMSDGDFPYRNDNGTTLAPDSGNDDVTMRRQNNAFRQHDSLLHVVGLLPGRRQVWATAGFLHRGQGVPPIGTLQANGAALTTDRLLTTTAYESRDDLGTSSQWRAQIYNVATWQRLDDLYGDLSGSGHSQTRDLSTNTGATLSASKSFADWFRLSAVSSARTERFRPSNLAAEGATTRPGARRFFAGGLEAAFDVSALGLNATPSLRVESAQDSIARSGRYRLLGPQTRDADYLLWNPRLALVQRPSETVSLRANLGRYGRLPSQLERYGNTGRILGNPDLIPEKGTNADVGAHWTYPGQRLRVSLDGALFAVWARNLIVFLPGGNYLRPSNLGRARILGSEGSATIDWVRRLRMFGQVTFTDARNQTDVSGEKGKQIPLRPRLRAYVRPEALNLPLLGRWRWGLYADMDVTGGNYQDWPNQVEEPARVLFGAGGHIEAPHWGMRLVASAYNLANSSVVDLNGYPLPGRSVFFTLQWTLSENHKETLE
jgi:outer membrane receptor protein involved in Fe transport